MLLLLKNLKRIRLMNYLQKLNLLQIQKQIKQIECLVVQFMNLPRNKLKIVN
jgi:hypothetical protein